MRTLAKIALSIALFGIVVGVSYLKSDLNTAQINEAVSGKTGEQLSESTADKPAPAHVVSETEAGGGATGHTARSGVQAKPAEKTVKESNTTNTQPDPAGEAPPATFTVSQTAKKPVTDSQFVDSKRHSSDVSSTPAATQAEPKPVDSTKIIADYYQARLDRLPTDLTSYERKVALKEIRDEVCDYFHISAKRLNKIAKARKVRYP